MDTAKSTLGGGIDWPMNPFTAPLRIRSIPKISYVTDPTKNSTMLLRLRNDFDTKSKVSDIYVENRYASCPPPFEAHLISMQDGRIPGFPKHPPPSLRPIFPPIFLPRIKSRRTL